MTWTLDWGFRDGSSEAPYYLVFRCYPFPRTSWGRTHLPAPIGQITLPGVQKFTRGTSHRYSEDSTMSENMLQALATADPALSNIKLGEGASVADLREAVYRKLAESAALFQQDTFGHINSTLGRIELLTTEAAFLGSSKRKYNFNWTLRSTSPTANSVVASDIGNTFELHSMPVVGDFADEGTLSQMTRMRPPNIWTIEAIGYSGINAEANTELWLGSPKPCILMQVYHSTDNQAYFQETSDRVSPYSYYISLNFVELENALNYQNQAILSRSEYFSTLSGGG